jgi:hypothetical protein
VFDNAVFSVVLSATAPTGNLERIPGDVNLAGMARARAVMVTYVADQQAFFGNFSTAYVKLVNLGAYYEGDTLPNAASTVGGGNAIMISLSIATMVAVSL